MDAQGDLQPRDGSKAAGDALDRVRRRRRRLKPWGIVGGVLLVLLAALGGGAEYYTARPQFCGTCHIMDPYYVGWQKDVHAGKGYARCVDCHYAPGEQHTLRAKFRGLSQVTSYFSGRSGAGRPKAHVSDASCLRSGCHDDRRFMTTELALGSVTFVHARHLDPQSPNLVKSREKLAALAAKLGRELGNQDLAAVQAIANAVEPADQRDRRLEAWLASRSRTPLLADVRTYTELLHNEARISQLANLRCASCHQFDPSGQRHFALARTTCYTCHFLNQPFNANTARCLSCHKPPAGPVPVHYGESSSTRPAAAPASAAITMDHAMILANNVDCVSCHADLVHGTGTVSLRDCQNCHDQERYVKDFDRRAIDVVLNYHRTHAGGQHARCNDCHQVIDHRLLPVADPGQAEALLSPVRRTCQHCHPDHHQEQVNLLLGRGGFAGTAGGMPNPMTGSRTNCRACHVEPGADPKGEAVIRSTVAACRGCHGKDYEELFAGWQGQIRARLDDAKALLATVEKSLAATTQTAGRTVPEAAMRVDRARANIELVAKANGIHNRNYAMLLLDQAIGDLEEARKLSERGVPGD